MSHTGLESAQVSGFYSRMRQVLATGPILHMWKLKPERCQDGPEVTWLGSGKLV